MSSKSDLNKSPSDSINQKVCKHLFHGQDEDQFRVFWAFWFKLGNLDIAPGRKM